jgi:protein-disulfide isomerase
MSDSENPAEGFSSAPVENPSTPLKAEVAAPPQTQARRGGLTGGLPAIVAVLAVAIALLAWALSSRQIQQLRQELAELQDAHQRLALEVTAGKKGGAGPVGQIIDVAKAPARGPDQAVVTLVEFSDYECPFCIRHFQQTMPLIEKNYIDTGRIRYVFRDFPIDANHPQAIRAHEAARCAAEQGRFWDLHTRLFSAPGTHTPLALEERAKDAGLNEATFRTCVANGRETAAVRKTASVAEDLGVTGTPWFFVGLRDPSSDHVKILKPIGGAQPYEQFAVAIDSALREAERK